MKILIAKDVARNKVLIIRLDAIGDFILWWDAAKTIYQFYQNNGNHVTLIGNCSWSDWARELRVADEVWDLDYNKFLNNYIYRWHLLRKVRKAGFDIVVASSFTRDFRSEDAIIHVSGAPERIGSQGEMPVIMPWRKYFSDRWYTKLLYTKKEPLMELERNAEFIRNIGVANYTAHISLLPILTNLPVNLDASVPYFVIFPGASRSAKRWPVDKFVSLLDQLYERTGWLGVLCGNKEEIIICEAIAKSARSASLILAGKTSLSELAEVLRGAKLLVSNDTSAVHIASAVNTASVCILGGGNYGRFIPYCERIETATPVPVTKKMDCFGCREVCIDIHAIEEPYPCINGVTVEQVMDECLKIVYSNKTTDY